MKYIVFGEDNRMDEVRRLLGGERGKELCCVFAPAVRLGLDETERIPRGSKVFAGGVRPEAEGAVNEKNLQVVRYSDNAEFGRKNALYTAESTLLILLSKINTQLGENKILLIGYGKCGRAIARYLFGLTADFTVMTSCPENAEIYTAAVGYGADIGAYDVIINTAPARIISDAQLETLKKTAVIIDISSQPYGLDHVYARSLGLDSEVYPALPAKYRYISAAKAIAELIKEDKND